MTYINKSALGRKIKQTYRVILWRDMSAIVICLNPCEECIKLRLNGSTRFQKVYLCPLDIP